MINNRIFLIKDRHFILFAYIFCILVYLPLLLFSKDFKLDKEWILDPIKNSNLNEFIKKLISFDYPDINPIRDISHFIDGIILQTFSLNFAIFHNWLLFALSCYFFYKILKKFISHTFSRIIFLYALFHPLFVNVIYVESWRKHILALFFTMLASYYFLENKSDTKTKLKISFFHTCSLLSVPINIGLPLIFCLIDRYIYKLEILKSIKKNIIYFFISIIIGAANKWYYTYSFLNEGMGAKFTEGDFGEKMLAFGRSIIQVIYPANYTIFYFKGSLENLIGIGVLVFLIYLTYKILKWKRSIIVWSIYFLPLIVVNFQSTGVFLFDTYCISSVFSILICFGLILELKMKKDSKNIKYLFVPILIFTILNVRESIHRTDINNFYELSYKKEPACPIINNYQEILLKTKRIEEFLEVSRRKKSLDCVYVNKQNVSKLRAIGRYYLYLDQNLDTKSKISILKNVKKQSPLEQLILSSLLLNEKKYTEANHHLEEFKEINQNTEADLYRVHFDGIISKDIFENCSNKVIECENFKKQYQKIKILNEK